MFSNPRGNVGESLSSHRWRDICGNARTVSPGSVAKFSRKRVVKFHYQRFRRKWRVWSYYICSRVPRVVGGGARSTGWSLSEESVRVVLFFAASASDAVIRLATAGTEDASCIRSYSVTLMAPSLLLKNVRSWRAMSRARHSVM